MEQVLRFGRTEVRAQERVVRVDGRPAPVGARAFDLLLALIERRDRMVPKNELLDLVWPGLVVEENNLAVQVSALRKALGTAAIATIPGRGYRFALPLEAIDLVSPPERRVEGLPVSAPPGEAAGGRTATHGAMPALPVPSSPLWGRDEDLAALRERLSDSRLVTLVGAGGIGKTSLALAAALGAGETFRDGVAWIELSEIQEDALVARAVAQGAGLPAVAGENPVPPLVEALQPLRMLLVLDNAEHVREGVAPLVQAILERARGVRVLVTSQVPLKLEAERLFRVQPLGLPAPDASVEEALRNGAVALFVEQARAADRRFALGPDNVALVVELCRRLDGVALAIKLAAARLPLLGLPGLAARLVDRLQLLTTGPRSAPARQQTLQAALDWSHGLLDERERRVFRRLAVFAGGFTLEMAGAAAGDRAADAWEVIDALGELVDRSLVDVDGMETPRYHLLETARAYARQRLDEAGERDATQARHAELMARLMDSAYDAYWTTPERGWLDAWLPEIDNVRAALERSAAASPATSVRIAGSASVLFLLTGQAPEARRMLAALETRLDERMPVAVAARYWLERSRVHLGISGVAMRDFALRARDLSMAIDDPVGRYLALRCAVGSGALLPDTTQAMLGEMAGLEQADWPERLVLQRRMAQMAVLFATGRLVEARGVADEVLGRASAARLDSVVAVARVQLAAVHLALADADGALAHARAHIASPAARRGNLVLQALATEAGALLLRDRIAEGRVVVEALAAASRSRAWEWFGLQGDLFALLAAAEGRPEAAAMLVGHADAAWRRAGTRDFNAARARERAVSRIQAEIDPPAFARLGREGERLDAEAVSALALGSRAT
jgi:predicted ATPase/DNA-binding winged helix-turn-helix (wHTH) protein